MQKVAVVVADPAEIVIYGVRTILTDSQQIEFIAGVQSLEAAENTISGISTPCVLLVDTSFGRKSVAELLRRRRSPPTLMAAVVWGESIKEAEAVRFLDEGAVGVIRKSLASRELLLSCIRLAAAKERFIRLGTEIDEAGKQPIPESLLTIREKEVLEALLAGKATPVICRELNMRPGTVKVHVKHIFKKTGVRSRSGLIFARLQGRARLG